jgi:adenylosuccinate synthase
VKYKEGGQELDTVPACTERYARCEPVYRDFPGWTESLTSAKKLSDLPKNARAYLDAMSEMAGVPISWVSVGPARDEVIEVGA